MAGKVGPILAVQPRHNSIARPASQERYWLQTARWGQILVSKLRTHPSTIALIPSSKEEKLSCTEDMEYQWIDLAESESG